MHRQKSPESLRALRLGAFHFFLNGLLMLAGLGYTLAGVIIQQKDWIFGGLSILALWTVSVLFFFIINSTWKCPLCLGKLWVNTGCRRHRKAVQSLGISYRLGVAISIAIGKSYRCPYCGEPFSTTKSRR